MKNPPAPRGAATSQVASPPSRLFGAVAVLALAGMAVAAVISWVHLQHEASGPGYTSFCNVSSTINCDRVLTSAFSRLLGVPVAYLALVAYAAITAGALAASRLDARRGSLAGRAVVAAVVASLVFSAYMAGVSIFVLETICLLCTALYLVAIAQGILVLAIRRRWASASGPVLSWAALGTWLVLSVIGVGAAAAWTWPESATLAGVDLSMEELRKLDPDFFDWYTSLPVVDAPEEGHAALGPDAAPVTIVEFSDFECAYCRQNHHLLEELVKRRPGQVRVLYRHFPLDASCNDAVKRTIHPRACRAAEASECAAAQGRFREMAEALFAHQGELFEANLERLARDIGLDVDRFRRCMEQRDGLSRVVADTRAGSALHVTSTPTLLINGRKVVGSLSRPQAYDVAVLIETHTRATR